ncbi:MAG: FAD/NAD(P)-binding protein [Planctomycetes bacterium]|nr:FAD/NAD(P)-binding protein [Planctomycetota bacterium]MCH9727281.1 FAD/NAD(P)-binding protein [Planctomycetota bacterium]MCH9779139.1 FAD/NAD(P)-binding protein [Planctomycetota bacterium]MCH9792305.1 FAD/NAD(P)-binding protein [Planctomycetota bacterium]MDF1743999.1 FAD/NAD(P)-binding protein [Gimesia sp.]
MNSSCATGETSNAQPNPWVPQTARIREITPEVDNVATYHLTLVDPAAANAYHFQPGQFNMLYVPGAGESAISMSGDPDSPETLAHTIRLAGNVTKSISEMKVGDTLGLRGPFGTSWPLEACKGRDVILVAGGIGLPPLRPLIYRLLAERQQYGRLHLLYGARSPDMRLYTAERSLWSERGLELKETVDRSNPGWLGNVGVVPLLLERLESFEPKQTTMMICGPELMMRFTARTAMQRGMTAEQIWVSTERNMQCAVGLCGHCQLGPEFICKDGPIFRYDQISPYFKVEGL